MTTPKNAPTKTARPRAKSVTKAPKSAARAPKSAVAAPTPEVVAAPVEAPVAREEFESIVRAEALGLARARDFRDGSMLGDWLRAEAAVLARLSAAGRAVAPRG